MALGSLTLVLFISLSASADPVVFTAFGDQLAGGRIVVFFSDGTVILKPLLAMPAQTGGAEQAGLFKFTVAGETFGADWTLTNLNPNFFITQVEIDLRGSISLFDDDTNPSTPDSQEGVEGVSRTAGPVERVSAEFLPWPSPDNRGDMFQGERIVWNPNVFGPNMVFKWHDDTDVVPEPATLLLLSTGLAGVAIKARKKLRLRNGKADT
jgi:hypothetical protein